MKSEWFKDWFNTQEYLNVYQHHNENDAEKHIKLIFDNVKVFPGFNVLDMACGAGRHAILLAKKGLSITAVDLSENLLSIAKQTAEKENLNIHFVHSDIRNYKSATKMCIRDSLIIPNRFPMFTESPTLRSLTILLATNPAI